MRPDIVALLKSSKNAFICGLIGIDPPATFRWAVLRAYFRAMVAFREAGKRHTQRKSGEWGMRTQRTGIQHKYVEHTQNTNSNYTETSSTEDVGDND